MIDVGLLLHQRAVQEKQNPVKPTGSNDASTMVLQCLQNCDRLCFQHYVIMDKFNDVIYCETVTWRQHTRLKFP